ncbi:MAG: hypothetical protein EHM93_16535 [Bacteroidales bacterium]|nr:MAG: hypothetical protein EHM93_16535 [Bacteroidales bacterium]
MKTRLLKWLGVLLIGLTGCYDYSSLDNIVIDRFTPEYVFPLLKSEITFKDLAEKEGTNSVVEQHPGSNMYFLAYRDTIDLGLATDLFPISSVSFPDNTLDFGAALTPGFTSFGPITIPFNQAYTAIPGAEIKRVDFTGGIIRITLTNTFSHRIDASISLTSLKNSSGVTHPPINFSPLNAGQTLVRDVDLNGYYLDLLELPNTYNNIKYSATATITSSGNPSLLGNVTIGIAINSPEYQQITGKITYAYNHTDQPYSIGIFNSTILAEQHIAEPKFSLNFINSFGLPSNVNFTRLEVENINGVIPITHEGPNNPGDLLIGSPNTLKNATPSKLCDTTKLVLTSSNSNIENIFDVAPNSLSFGATFNIGDAADPSHDYFVRNDSKFELQSEIEIPLKGWVVTNKIADTVLNVEWPDFKNDLNLTNQEFRIKFKFNNGLPLNMYLQIKFLDTNGALVTQLFDADSEQLIKSSPVDPESGESTGKSLSYSYIAIDEAKYNQMALSQDMIIIFKFTTGGTLHQNITIQSSDAIAIEMSLEASGTVKPKPF